MATYSVSGRFEGRGDSDWYRVYLEGGQWYFLDSNGNDGALRTAAGDVVMYDYQKAYVAQSGWYFVEARAIDGDLTTYNYTLQTLTDDAIAGSPLTNRSIGVGQSVSVEAGYAAHSADDWFGFDAVAGKSYQFDATVPGSPQAVGLAIYDATGTKVSDSGHFSAGTSGHYFVGVDRDFLSSYTLRMSAIADDCAQTTATRGVARVGTAVSGQFEGAGDIDWFRITLAAGHNYVVSGEAGSFAIADASGAMVRSFAEGRSVFSAATGGTYYLIARDFRGDGPFGYQVSVSELAGDQADNATTTAKVVANGAIVGSTVDAFDDVDWWSIQAQAGVSYQIAGAGKVTYRVYDAASHQLTGDRAGSFTAATNGTYYIAVAGNGTVQQDSYQFSVKSYADDYAATTATAGRAVVGQEVTGRLERIGDTDWFAIDLQAGVTYTAGDYEVLGRFRDKSGAIVSGRDGGATFTPTVSGTYYLEVAEGPETYEITVRTVPGDIPGNASTTVELPAVWIGTAKDDRHAGNDHADALYGADGNDRLYGLGGDDRLEGNGGNDLLTGGAGNDTLDGGDGVNRLIGEEGNDTMSAFEGSATMTGGAGNDIYVIGAGIHVTVVEKAGGGIDTIRTDAPSLTLRSEVENLEGFAEGTGQTLTGNTLANTITGSSGNDIVSGDAASDTLYGNAGNDRLIGGDGADTLYGGTGDDLIRGGTGSDLLSGGAGADRFLFIPGDLGVSGDRITDFSQTEHDRMDLSGYGPLTFIGAAAFSGVAGQLRATLGATSTLVQGDLNGDKVVDFAIRLDGQFLLTKSDFVLAGGSSASVVDAVSPVHAGDGSQPVDLLHIALV